MFLEWKCVWVHMYIMCALAHVWVICIGFALVHLCIKTMRRTIQNQILAYVKQVPNTLNFVNIFWRSLVNTQNMLSYHIKCRESQGLIEFILTLGQFFIFLSTFSNMFSQFCFLSCHLELHYEIGPFIPYVPLFQTLMRKKILW